MAKKINVTLNLLKSEEEIALSEDFPFDPFYLDACRQTGSWIKRWKERNTFVKPGVGQDHVFAIEGTALADPSLDFSPIPFGTATKNFLLEQFSQDDILSCKCGIKDEGAACHFLIFPLHGRVLDPYPWIDDRKKQLKQDLLNEYLERLSIVFKVDLSDDIEIENNGHTQYLDSFPKVTTTQEEEYPIVYETYTEEDSVQTDYPRDKIKAIINKAVYDFTSGTNQGDYIKMMDGNLSVEGYLEIARMYLLRLYPDISSKDMALVIKKIRSSAVGYYILDPLIDDESISDIKVMSAKEIRVKVRGNRRNSNLSFMDSRDYMNFINNIITRYQLDTTEAMHVRTDLTTSDKARLRLNLTLPSINTGGNAVFHIRKVPKIKMKMEDLVREHMLDEKTANYLIWAARNAKGIVFTGKGSSGKTTLMNALLECTPANASGLVIQESEELFTETRPELTFEHITPKYGLKDLAKNGLLTDIDYFIIGEVKGDEAMYFINACDTGNKGWCTVHSPSSKEAINKLADYVMYASKYNREEALYMLKELQVVVFLRNFKVVEISEVTGWDPVKKDLTYKPVLIDTKGASLHEAPTEEEDEDF